MAAEAAFGFLSGSLALLADAGHNLSDVLGLAMAWGAYLLSKRPGSYGRTYGWKSATIVAALANAVLLLVAIGAIAWEAFGRLGSPQTVSSRTIIVVAAVGVAAAGLGIMATGWLWIDPAISLVIAAVILIGTWRLFKDSINLALQAVPSGIDVRAIEEYLKSRRGVEAVHDLHVWPISTTDTALTAHMIKPSLENEDRLLDEIQEKLREFGIDHVTIQIERSDVFWEPIPGCDWSKQSKP